MSRWTGSTLTEGAFHFTLIPVCIFPKVRKNHGLRPLKRLWPSTASNSCVNVAALHWNESGRLWRQFFRPLAHPQPGQGGRCGHSGNHHRICLGGTGCFGGYHRRIRICSSGYNRWFVYLGGPRPRSRFDRSQARKKYPNNGNDGRLERLGSSHS